MSFTVCQIVNDASRSWLFVKLMVLTGRQNSKNFHKKSWTVYQIGITEQAVTELQNIL